MVKGDFTPHKQVYIAVTQIPIGMAAKNKAIFQGRLNNVWK